MQRQGTQDKKQGLYFGNKRIRNGQFVSIDQTKESMELDFSDSGLHSYFFYDISAPYPQDNYNSPYIHNLVVNIPDNRYNEGDTIFEFIPPSPPKDSDPHTYYVEIYRQQSPIPPFRFKKRNNFDLKRYIITHSLEKIAKYYFQSGYTNNITDIQTYSTDSKIRKDADLTEQEKKNCSCRLDLAAQQPNACFTDKAWFKERDGKQCYNPYAVCGKSTGTNSKKCDLAYDFANMSDLYLVGYAKLQGIPIPHPYVKKDLLKTILDNVEESKQKKLAKDNKNNNDEVRNSNNFGNNKSKNTSNKIARPNSPRAIQTRASVSPQRSRPPSRNSRTLTYSSDSD